MRKLILPFIISLVLFLLYSSYVYADIQIISPSENSIVKTKIINFQWKNTDNIQKYCYSVELGPQPSTTKDWYPSVGLSSTYERNTQYTPPSNWSEALKWWLKYGLVDSNGNCPLKYSTIPYSFKYLPQDSSLEQENTDKKIETKVVKKKQIQSTEDTLNWNVETSEELPEVLGVASTQSICKFKFTKGQSKASLIACNISSIEITLSKINNNIVYIGGKYTPQITAEIDIYKCQRKLLNPISWFKCIEEFEKTVTIPIPFNYWFKIVDKSTKKEFSINYFKASYGTFELISQNIPTSSVLNLEYESKVKNKDYGIEIHTQGSISLKIEDIQNENQKPFSFPLNHLVGITQWHGNTYYQKPHTGIDIGAVNDSVLAVANGEIVGEGWDSYYGDCFSGGKYILIHQANGMYTVYFHLSSFLKSVGQNVKQGEIIGTSGNTGSWNCQPLGYHLHFETRLNRVQNSHVDPVKYINIDWSIIPTLRSDVYPERLTGDNPHPWY